ncbi:hypothetical protein ACJ41O_003898 [Fusarium nematophilum]
MQPPTPNPLFLYGTLRAIALLTWATQNDTSNHSSVAPLPVVRPAKLWGYDWLPGNYNLPSVVQAGPEKNVEGLLVETNSTYQRGRLDYFEGWQQNTLISVPVSIVMTGETVRADMWYWAGRWKSPKWDLRKFEKDKKEIADEMYRMAPGSAVVDEGLGVDVPQGADGAGWSLG